MTTTMADIAPKPEDVRDKILHVLSIYPKLSPSHLQLSLAVQARIWKPILEEMIVEGLVVRELQIVDTPTGRCQTYTILQVGENRV